MSDHSLAKDAIKDTAIPFGNSIKRKPNIETDIDICAPTPTERNEEKYHDLYIQGGGLDVPTLASAPEHLRQVRCSHHVCYIV